jgi:hypothetical protein
MIAVLGKYGEIDQMRLSDCSSPNSFPQITLSGDACPETSAELVENHVSVGGDTAIERQPAKTATSWESNALKMGSDANVE